MAKVNHEITDYFDLTDGVNTVDSGIRLKPTEARDLQNVDLFPIGGISQRKGFAPLNSVAFGTGATGLYMARYSLNGGTNIAYLVSGTKIGKMDSSLGGTWTDISGALVITAGANNIWNFAILNDIVVLGNGTDTPIQIDSTGAASALSAGLPFTSFAFAVESRGYMWYFVPTVGGAKQYDRGYFSSINDPATVGTNDYVDVAKGQGGDVRGAVDYKTYLFIFKRHGIYQITYQPTRVNSAGLIFPWTEFANPVVPGVGTQSPRSIVKFTTPSTHAFPGQEYVFFVDQFGCPRIFDGITTLSFFSKIGRSRDSTILSLTNMDATRSPYAFAINYPSRNQILIFLSRLNSQQDTCWVLDYSTKFALTRHKYASAFNVGALFEQSNGVFKPYVGDYSGMVHQLDQGTSDNGQAIDAYFVTGDSSGKSPLLRKKWNFSELRGQTDRTDGTFTTINIDITVAGASVQLNGQDNGYSTLPIFTVSDGTNQYQLVNAVTVSAGTSTFTFKCTTAGVVNPAIGSITTIVTATTGISAVTNSVGPTTVGSAEIVQTLEVDYYFDGNDSPDLTDTVALSASQTKWGISQPMTWGVTSWAKQGIATKTSEVNHVAKTMRMKVRNSVANAAFMLEGFSVANDPLGTAQS